MTAILLQPPPHLLRLLAHDLRWNMLKALTVGDYRVQELVDLVNEPMNLVSYHLKKLRDDGLVNTRRSDADGRDVYYSLDLDNLCQLYREAGASLHPALQFDPTPADLITAVPDKVRVLFVCTHNSARSQMAEGLMRHITPNSIDVHSAGSHPTHLHPDAVRTMDALGINIRGQAAKHFTDYEGHTFDYVITVCDLAREVCPTFPGDGQQIHWGFPDPAKIDDPAARTQAFEQTALRLKSRITHFLSNLNADQS